MPGLWLLFYADAGVQHMLQRILPHYLFKGKRVIAASPEPGSTLCKWYPVLPYIIHARTQPALAIGCQAQVYLLRITGIGPLARKFQPYIIIAVCICMTQYQVNIVGCCRICNGKTKIGLIAARPFLLFKRSSFFKYTNRAAGCQLQAANKKQYPGFVWPRWNPWPNLYA